MLTDNLFFEEALQLIGGATSGESLDLTTYFFAYRSDEDVKAKQVYQSLVDASHRGVKIRVLLERNNSPDVNQSITQANLQNAERFAQDGIATVYLDPTDKITHAKIIRLSSATHHVALIGSTNIYRGDFDENHQVNFLVRDIALIDALGAYLNQKFAYEGTKYSLLPLRQ